MEENILRAIDINGKENIFYMCISNVDSKQLSISVFDNQEFKGDGFEFSIIKKDTHDNFFKVQNMFAHDKKYRKKGLPKALLIYSKKHFQQSIYSSSLIPQGNDWLSPEGKKLWKRLEKEGFAIFIIPQEKQTVFKKV